MSISLIRDTLATGWPAWLALCSTLGMGASCKVSISRLARVPRHTPEGNPAGQAGPLGGEGEELHRLPVTAPPHLHPPSAISPKPT